MRRLAAAALVVLCGTFLVQAHDMALAVTWNREISRIVYDRCAACHRPAGSAFSLMTYAESQRNAVAIKDAVLSRRMPPWGAVKGFGSFRNDQALNQEQIELIVSWVETGSRRGNNPLTLPKEPTFEASAAEAVPPRAISISGEFVLAAPVMLDGILPERVPAQASMQIVARRPDGSVEPLVWLHNYLQAVPHPFLFRQPLSLPAGTVIAGVRPPAAILLLPVEPASH